MASQKNFAITPSVSISRSKFRRPSQHKTSFDLGDLIPIYVDADILPGDTVSLDLASLVRMSTPIAPIMDNIHIDYYAFFVPNRILWDGWKEFMGENTSTAGAVSNPPEFPVAHINGGGTSVGVGSIGDYMGLPVGLASVNAANDPNLIKVSRLPGMAYYLIYSEWFRDQNLIAPIQIRKFQNGLTTLAYQGSTDFYYRSKPLKVAKDSDYFTRALPFAQKGAPVSLPLGTTAPIINTDNGDTRLILTAPSGGPNIIGTENLTISGYTNPTLSGEVGSEQQVGTLRMDKMVADLSAATAATINQLRFAFQYQKFLEKDAQPFYRASINRAISVNA